MSATPTSAQFQAFEKAYDYFNQVLFHYELPQVLLNLSRKSKAMGFAAPNRWARRSNNLKPGDKGELHELSINPEILMMDVIEVYSTLVHEQCHIWQFHAGKPSRRTYHNKEWAEKMLEVGLTPSSTGQPGGKMTGQAMSDYPTPEGVFLEALSQMPEYFKLPFVSTEVMKRQTAGGSAVKKNKMKYTCPGCQVNVWGKDGLQLACIDCELHLRSNEV